MPSFKRYIGIDYSGAQTPTASLPGLRVYLAENDAPPVEVAPPPAFPLRYFETHGLLPDWPAFLDDFQRHWPTDGDHTYVDFVRQGAVGNGAARMGIHCTEGKSRRIREPRGKRATNYAGFRNIFLPSIVGINFACGGYGGIAHISRELDHL